MNKSRGQRRECTVCNREFWIAPDEILRLQKEGLPKPSRCATCTIAGSRFATLKDLFPATLGGRKR